VWDSVSDIAALFIEAQDTQKDRPFGHEFQIGDYIPRVGEEVDVLGFGNMETASNVVMGDGKREFALARRPVLRRGSVSAIRLEGDSLCRGPCVETTIPVFNGMSGGPALTRSMQVFGLISTGQETPFVNDRSVPGSTTIALLLAKKVASARNVRVMSIGMNNIGVAPDRS
jgi:hypothetical protein